MWRVFLHVQNHHSLSHDFATSHVVVGSLFQCVELIRVSKKTSYSQLVTIFDTSWYLLRRTKVWSTLHVILSACRGEHERNSWSSGLGWDPNALFTDVEITRFLYASQLIDSLLSDGFVASVVRGGMDPLCCCWVGVVRLCQRLNDPRSLSVSSLKRPLPVS